MESLRRTTAALFLFAYAWANGTGGTWVLCYGADGHVTVEAGASACCLGTAAESASLAPESERAAAWTSVESLPGCGACTDVPLFAAASTAHVGPLRPQVTEAVAASFALLLPANALEAPPGAAWPPGPGVPRSDGTLTRLRTVVLRC